MDRLEPVRRLALVPQAFRSELVSVGFDSNIGMLIDTSRNGCGTARPTGPGATTSVDAYVNGGRIDRRIHAGNWDEGKGFDRMCDPTYTGNARNGQQHERRPAERADLRCLVLRAVPGAHEERLPAALLSNR